MIRHAPIAIAAVLALGAGPVASAQTAKMTIRPESKVTLAGSSNVHDWACNSSTFVATIELDTNYATHPFTSVPKPISTVVVDIPVKSLKCGHGKMDENMYKALKADQFPDIHYVLDSYEILRNETSADAFAARTTGQLTVAGRTAAVEIPITALRKEGGAMLGEGTLRMLMTDFGIKPPVALLGTLRTRNEITVSFRVLLDKSVIVALSQGQ